MENQAPPETSEERIVSLDQILQKISDENRERIRIITDESIGYAFLNAQEKNWFPYFLSKIKERTRGIQEMGVGINQVKRYNKIIKYEESEERTKERRELIKEVEKKESEINDLKRNLGRLEQSLKGLKEVSEEILPTKEATIKQLEENLGGGQERLQKLKEEYEIKKEEKSTMDKNLSEAKGGIKLLENKLQEEILVPYIFYKTPNRLICSLPLNKESIKEDSIVKSIFDTLNVKGAKIKEDEYLIISYQLEDPDKLESKIRSKIEEESRILKYYNIKLVQLPSKKRMLGIEKLEKVPEVIPKVPEVPKRVKVPAKIEEKEKILPSKIKVDEEFKIKAKEQMNNLINIYKETIKVGEPRRKFLFSSEKIFDKLRDEYSKITKKYRIKGRNMTSPSVFLNYITHLLEDKGSAEAIELKNVIKGMTNEACAYNRYKKANSLIDLLDKEVRKYGKEPSKEDFKKIYHERIKEWKEIKECWPGGNPRKRVWGIPYIKMMHYQYVDYQKFKIENPFTIGDLTKNFESTLGKIQYTIKRLIDSRFLKAEEDYKSHKRGKKIKIVLYEPARVKIFKILNGSSIRDIARRLKSKEIYISRGKITEIIESKESNLEKGIDYWTSGRNYKIFPSGEDIIKEELGIKT